MNRMNKRGSLALSFFLLVLIVGVLAALYLIMESETARLGLLISIVIVVGTGIIFLFLQYSRGGHRLNKKMESLESLLPHESLDVLKGKYLAVYNHYLKLSEKDKRNFYGKLTKLREGLEEQLKAEKKIEILLKKLEKAGLQEMKKIYDELQQEVSKLSKVMQEKYYPYLMHLKERLEGGS